MTSAIDMGVNAALIVVCSYGLITGHGDRWLWTVSLTGWLSSLLAWSRIRRGRSEDTP